MVNSLPIFVHSSFRVGSTWMWLRFCSNNSTLSYYEIFNEHLATLTRREARTKGSLSWSSKHPEVKAYFDAYLPLLQPGGGVRGFAAPMAFERFFAPGGMTEAETAYVGGLIGHARAEGRVPVLTSTRSLGRVAALRAAFGGTHVLLYRNMFRQWASCTEQWMLNTEYFLDSVARIIAAAGRDRKLARLAPLVSHGMAPWRPESLKAMLLVQAILYDRARQACDVVVDIDRLALDAGYRGATEAGLLAGTGLAVDLSSARLSMAYSLVDAGPGAALRKELRAQARLSGVGEWGMAALDAAVGEYEAYRTAHGTQMQLPAAHLELRERKMQGLRAELALLRAARRDRLALPRHWVSQALRRVAPRIVQLARAGR